MKIAKGRIDNTDVILQLDDDKLEFVVKNPDESSQIVSRTFTLDLDIVWQEVKPYFIKRVKELNKKENQMIDAVRKNEQEKYYVCLIWDRFGGSFQKGLASALAHSDFGNTAKIKSNWRDEWNEALEQIKTQPEYKKDL